MTPSFGVFLSNILRTNITHTIYDTPITHFILLDLTSLRIMIKRTNYEWSNCTFFSSILLPPPLFSQTLSSAPYSQTPSVPFCTSLTVMHPYKAHIKIQFPLLFLLSMVRGSLKIPLLKHFCRMDSLYLEEDMVLNSGYHTSSCYLFASVFTHRNAPLLEIHRSQEETEIHI